MQFLGMVISIIGLLAQPLRAQSDPRRVNYWCDRARATIEQMITAGESHGALNPRMLAMELAQVRGDARDLDLLNRAMELAPMRDEWWQLERAASYWRLGERDQAEQILQTLEGDEKMRGAVDGARLALIGRVPPGREYDGPWIRDHAATAGLYINPQAYGIAVQQYRELAEGEGGGLEMQRTLFRLLLRGSDPTAAISSANKLHTLEQRIEALVQIAEQCERNGDVRSARGVLHDASAALIGARQKVSISCAIRLAEAAWALGMPGLSAEVTNWAVLRAERPDESLRLVSLRQRIGEAADIAQLEQVAYPSPGETDTLDGMERKRSLLAIAIAAAWRDDIPRLQRAIEVLKAVDLEGEMESEEIPLAYAYQQRFGDAVNLAGEVLEREAREFAVLRIQREALRQERFEDAIWCIGSFGKTSAGQFSKRRAVFSAGVYLARAGRLDEVERIARGLEEQDLKAGLYLIVAKEIQGTGQWGLLARLW